MSLTSRWKREVDIIGTLRQTRWVRTLAPGTRLAVVKLGWQSWGAYVYSGNWTAQRFDMRTRAMAFELAEAMGRAGARLAKREGFRPRGLTPDEVLLLRSRMGLAPVLPAVARKKAGR